MTNHAPLVKSAAWFSSEVHPMRVRPHRCHGRIPHEQSPCDRSLRSNSLPSG
jgi:hypothetical protein